MRVHYRLTILSILLMATWASAEETYIAPQAELFWTHDNIFRSHFIASGNWLVHESKFGSAWGQYDLDIGVAPFFRRYVYKDPNAEKAKRVSFRVGYLQVSDLKDDPNGFDEKRPLGEIVFRFPIGRSWLVEDKNRGEYRIFHDDDLLRYRNRLRVEHSMLWKSFRFTPYSTGEAFYEGRTHWNEVQAALGVDIPWFYKMILELECMGQYVGGELNTLSWGIVFQKFW
jgi:hypothetical protein